MCIFTYTCSKKHNNLSDGITMYDMIYLLTAIGLTPGGRSTVHIYTQTIHRTIQNNVQYATICNIQLHVSAL